jgi:hypothetical protein
MFRKTTLVGSLLTIAVMTNVLMINMFFDVPVKLLSIILLLIAVLITSLNFKPIWNFFVKGVTTKKYTRAFPFKDREWKIIGYTIKGIIVTAILGIQTYSIGIQYLNKPAPLGIAGIYEVEKFVLSSEPLPPITTDSTRWNRIIIDDINPGRIAIDFMNGDRVQFYAEINEISKTIAGKAPLHPEYFKDSYSEFTVSWDSISDMELSIQGSLGKDSIYVRLKKTPIEKIPLLNRGFNWINEVPYNH